MKMTKLYTTVFDEELKSRGFKKKAKLYYRLNGDNLQGVVINSCNPYMLDFYSAPYWMKNVQAYLAPLYKGDWAEHGMEISTSRYYREEEEQLNTDQMNFCFMLAKKHILPVLDEIYDLNSYIDHLKPRWRGFGREEAPGILDIYLDEIDEKYSHIKFERIRMKWWLWMRYTYSAFLEYGCIHGDLQKGYDYMLEKGSFIPESWRWVDFAKEYYNEFMTEDGLERAKQYLEERRQIMLPRLRDELGLSVFNL